MALKRLYDGGILKRVSPRFYTLSNMYNNINLFNCCCIFIYSQNYDNILFSSLVLVIDFTLLTLLLILTNI